MFKRILFWLKADRFGVDTLQLGPDMPLTHMLLYSSRLQRYICKKTFANFDDESEFRPGAYAVCTTHIEIGKRVTIRPQTMLFASSDISTHPVHIKIEDDVLIGSGCHIYVSNHKFDDPTKFISTQGHQELKPVVLRKGCWIAESVIILPCVEIGINALVGVCRVVIKSISAYSLYAGVQLNF